MVEILQMIDYGLEIPWICLLSIKENQKKTASDFGLFTSSNDLAEILHLPVKNKTSSISSSTYPYRRYFRFMLVDLQGYLYTKKIDKRSLNEN